MEVHHHSHTERKKWTHYLWEFLMLFLAVSLGFFVENQREHYIEHQRAKNLVKSLVSDLRTDTARLHRVMHDRKNILAAIDSLLSKLRSTEYPKDLPAVYRHTYNVIYKIHFQRADGTISQLKNAGYLRYFSNSAIPALLVAYDEAVSSLLDFEKTYSYNLDMFVALVFRHFDADVSNLSWADFRNRQPVPENVEFYDFNMISLNNFKSNAVSLKHLNLVSLLMLDRVEMTALEAIDILKREYRLN